MKALMKDKYLLPPLKDCIWCEGVGYEFIDCGNEHNGYDYRDVCRCRKRDKRYLRSE